MAAKNFMCFCSKILKGPAADCAITVNIKALSYMWYSEEILVILLEQ